MEITINILLRTKDGLEYIWAVNGMNEYESTKRKIRARKGLVLRSWIEVHEKPATTFGQGRKLTDTKDVDCALITI